MKSFTTGSLFLWVISVYTINLRSVHAVAYIDRLLLFVAENGSISRVHRNFFPQFHVHRQFFSF